MNAIGELGRLIIAYQSQIEIVLLCILALIVLVAVIRAFIRAERTKNVLQDIDEKVTNIGKTIGDMQLNAKDKDISAVKSVKEETDGDKGDNTCTCVEKEVNVNTNDENKASCLKDSDRKESGKRDLDKRDSSTYSESAAVKGDDHKREFHWGIESLDEIPSDKRDKEETAWEKAVLMRKAEKAAHNLFSEDEEEPDIVSEVPKKYFSRNDNVDKKGNVYTEEMLKEQIR